MLATVSRCLNATRAKTKNNNEGNQKNNKTLATGLLLLENMSIQEGFAPSIYLDPLVTY